MIAKSFRYAVASLLVLGMISQSTNAEITPLKQGERIVFLGDSITQAGASPKGYVTQVREAITKSHPDLKVEVIGAGISGNRVPDLQKRLDRDVISKKPSVVIVYIGINDVWHSTRGKGTSKEDFESGMNDVIKRCNDAGARVIVCTPTVIGEKHDGSNKLDKMLEEYSEISRKVAKETKCQLIDLRKEFIDALKKQNPDNKDKGILTSDTVHLNPAGNQFLASLMLKGLGANAKSGTASKTGKKLRHVVVFKFKEDTAQAKIDEIAAAFAQLPKKIDSIVDFEWGTNNSPEDLNQGYTHCFLVTFADEKGREKYLPHPAHKEFVSILKPSLESAFVIDYWAE